MADILVAGNVNIETTVRVNSFPIEYQPTTFAFFGIGSRVSAVGYNIAKALTTLGNSVTFVSITGRDLAAQLGARDPVIIFHNCHRAILSRNL